MAAFTFNQAAGTQLPTIDANWTVAGNYGRTFETKGSYLDVTANYTTATARYINGHGAAQSSKCTYQAGNTPANTTVNCQATGAATASLAGYGLEVGATTWQVRRNGVFVSNGSHSENVTTADYTAEISINGAGLVVGKINATTVYSGTDATPLTGGYPGFVANNSTTLTSIRILDWTDGVSASGPTELPPLTMAPMMPASWSRR